VLFKRFPKLRAPTESPPVIQPDKRALYHEFQEDFEVLDREVGPVFREYDLQALRDQNRFRRQHVIIVIGSALVTGLGGIQAIFSAERWPGFVLAVLGLALASSSRWAKETASQTTYLGARIKAERLRALHFLYLSKTGLYAGEGRELALRRAVLAIKDGKELE
jgi:hypothetical protein